MATVYQTRYDRFRKIIPMHGGSRAAVAEKLGITRQYMQAVASEAPTKKIGDKLARKIEETFGYERGYLDAMVQIAVEVDDKFVEVPLLDVRASMGPGALQMFDDEVVQLIRLSKDWVLQNFRGASIKSLAIITAKGDSMSPTYEDGSVLLVNTAKQVIDVEGVYVMARGGELFVKRMLRRVSGGYTMISDNHAYPPQTVQEEELDQLKVLGKVLVALTPKRL